MRTTDLDWRDAMVAKSSVGRSYSVIVTDPDTGRKRRYGYADARNEDGGRYIRGPMVCVWPAGTSRARQLDPYGPVGRLVRAAVDRFKTEG